MVKIRLFRTGKKHQPQYRIVAMDSRTKRQGRVLEILGFYQPLAKSTQIQIKKNRFDFWLSVGAQPTQTVASLIRKARVIN